jgi:SNF2 family DNA or RNA helicase
MIEVEEDLEFSGRKSNLALGNFRLYGKSRHQQYFTSLKLANLIYKMLEPAIADIESTKVLDPTCGSGRLLLPWKRAGANILGIELDKEASIVAKRLLGEKNVRTGDILDYAHLLSYSFDVAVINPPYGIMWQPHDDMSFDATAYGGNVESQAATIEICTSAFGYNNGLLAAIIPSSTFINQKDSKLRDHLFKNYLLLLRVNLGTAFKEEYGIEVDVDLVIAMRESYYGREPGQNYETIDVRSMDEDSRDALLIEKMHEIISHQGIAIYNYTRGIDVPNLSKIKPINVEETPVNIKPSGYETSLPNKALIDFNNEILPEYNPVYGVPTGLAEACLTESALILRGVEPAIETLSRIGFKPQCDTKDREKIKQLQERYAYLSLPLYRPKSHQLLSYFYDKEYRAKEDVYDPDGNLLFLKGKSYHLHPAWERRRETVDVAKAYDEGKKKYYKIKTDIDRGYLAIRVQTEDGDRVFNEENAKGVELFARAFELPDIKDIAETYPEKVDAFRNRVAEEMPFLFDYQREDVARLAMKPFGYLGYDMGGGKTVTSAAWAVLRGYRIVLAVCHSGLVKNWINELNKFGFRVKRLTTHRSVDKLLKEYREVRRGETTFYVTSYEFLALDTGIKFDPWDCVEYDKDGNVRRETFGNTYRKCSDCHREYSKVFKTCPKCEELEKWTGTYCNACGYSAYSYTPEKRMYPAYKRISKIIDAVIVDEAQTAKSKNTMRGRAIRALRSKGRLILTGTLMKGYVHDIFWNVGWLLGHGNPLFPYEWRGGSKRFLDEFGTFKYVTKEFEDTLHEGRAQLIPEVSNLNRFWRLIAPFTIRRMKDEMIELPKKNKHILMLPMDPDHADIYNEFQQWAKKLISKEFERASREDRDVNMGVISNALWKLRFAATVPTAESYLCVENGPCAYLENGSWNKLNKIVEIVREVRRQRSKVIIFSALRPMVSAICKALDRERIRYTKITASDGTSKRFDMIQDFSEKDEITAIVAGLNVLNRGFTITAANNVIISDIEYSPESTMQAEDRAHRTGQERDVNIYYLFAQDTIDEDMFSLVSQKQAAISNAIDGKARYLDVARILDDLNLSVSNVQLEVAKKVSVSNPIVVEAVPGKIKEEREVVEIVEDKDPDDDLWEKLYELKQMEAEERAKKRRERIKADTRQISLFPT